VEYFNLDAIISVGYRVNSSQVTRFRQWATRVLREHLTQGFYAEDTLVQQTTADYLEQRLGASISMRRKTTNFFACASCG